MNPAGACRRANSNELPDEIYTPSCAMAGPGIPGPHRHGQHEAIDRSANRLAVSATAQWQQDTDIIHLIITDKV
jgi:hypothetical protein